MSEDTKNIYEKDIFRENICCCNNDHYNENKFYIKVDDTKKCYEDCYSENTCQKNLSVIEAIILLSLVCLVTKLPFN